MQISSAAFMPILWDVTSTSYRRKDIRDMALEDVKKELGLEIGVDEIQRKFKSLKDTFMKNHRKVMASKKTGSGADGVFRPKWGHYEDLRFLVKDNKGASEISDVKDSEEKMLPGLQPSSVVLEDISCRELDEDPTSELVSVDPEAPPSDYLFHQRQSGFEEVIGTSSPLRDPLSLSLPRSTSSTSISSQDTPNMKIGMKRRKQVEGIQQKPEMDEVLGMLVGARYRDLLQKGNTQQAHAFVGAIFKAVHDFDPVNWP
uniref:SKI family transcriptional corepressor 1 n=2 Tax=Lygus hesperus TaxID=30085 RepID=A0A0A9W5L7_LYGHE